MIINKTMKKLSIFIIVSILVISCGIFKKKSTDRDDIEFMNYLKFRGIDPDTVKVFSRYYRDSYNYEREQERQALLKNPYLRINEVYVSYGTIGATFYIYSDNGRVYSGRVQITDPTQAEVINNKKVVLKQPVIATFFKSFDLIENKLYTNSWEKKTPWSKEQKWIWIHTAKKDTLHFIESYKAKNEFSSIKKQFLAKRKKLNDYLIYQPKLKVEKAKKTYQDGNQTNVFIITGEFDLDKPWDSP